MAYTALYRKFRPREFRDVKGQEHIVKTLQNQIKAERIGHAYLFCGTRGTGKTTIAKILARAVNCENPIEGNPCNECSVCRSINEQRSLNVVEIDAASNNGVDNIREIIEEVQYSPTEGKYKVYIIDEVHMLSTGAFNALLKTLEEPPSYVIFILATTEAHKIPITILSRCQRYDFRRITIDTIAARLQELLDIEGIDADEKAIRYVAKMADGSMRDGLSLLDQCIAFYLGETLTYEKVLEVLGAVDTDVFHAMFDAIQNVDATAAMELLERLIIQGKELGQFVNEFVWYLRNLLLLQNSAQAEDIIDVSSEQMQEMRQRAAQTDMNVLMRHIRILSELSNQLRYATQKRVLLEVTLIKMCHPQMESDMSSILERIKVMEKQLEQGIVVKESAVSATVQATAIQSKVEEEPVKPPALTEDIQKIADNWNYIVMALSPALREFVSHVKPTAGEGNVLVLVCFESLDKDFIEKPEHLEEITKVIEAQIKKTIVIKLRSEEGNKESFENVFDISKITKMNIEYE